MSFRRGPSGWYALVLFAVNLIVVSKLLGVEYLSYTGSVEGTFIAIPRIMAEHPGDWTWWPFWNCGLPFELTYLPFEHWVVAIFSVVTGFTAAHSLHIVSAFVYALGPVTAFGMARALSKRPLVSFLAALLYSFVSLSALFVPDIRLDLDGAWNPRRLHVLVFYGGNPEVFALTLLPLALLLLHRSMVSESPKWKILAGLACAAVALTSAFGIAMLALAAVSLMLVYRSIPWWRGPLTIGLIGLFTYCLVSPWLSPMFVQAVRENAPTSGGDFRYTRPGYIAASFAVAVFPAIWWLLRWLRLPLHLQFFWLVAAPPAAAVALWYTLRVALVPQPSRYHLEMDLTLILALVFTLPAVPTRMPRMVQKAAVLAVLLGCGLQTYRFWIYGNNLIKPVEKTSLSEYKVATWLSRNMPNARAFLPGSTGFLFNAFTDNQQLAGGHDQHTRNGFVRIVEYILYSGYGMSDYDAAISIFWLKAFGVHALSMPGPQSTEISKSAIFTHPHKFEGVLPVLWQDRDDIIYEVPGRSESLAHVIPTSAIVTKKPIHALDTAPAKAFVAALDDVRNPPASFEWREMAQATIRASVDPGQVISVQESYAPGWEAWDRDTSLAVREDALGQIIVVPESTGPRAITLKYTGGQQKLFTRTLTICALIGAILYCLGGRISQWFKRCNRAKGA